MAGFCADSMMQATPQSASSAAGHLQLAQRAMEAISTEGLARGDADGIARLQRDFAALKDAFAHPIADAAGSPPRGNRRGASSDWRAHYYAVQRDLSRLDLLGLGPDSKWLAGRPTTRSTLQQFRNELQAFYSAAARAK